MEVHSRENGYFFFKFGEEEECNRILQNGPWLFDGRLIVLKRWTEGLELERDLLSSVPIWVRMPSLPLKLWSRDIISRIASLMGKPLFMDRATTMGDRIDYARCFIDIKAGFPFPNKVSIQVEEGELQDIDIEYEWIPPACAKCKSFGHLDTLCPTKEVTKEVWVPKATVHITDNNKSFQCKNTVESGKQSDITTGSRVEKLAKKENDHHSTKFDEGASGIVDGVPHISVDGDDPVLDEQSRTKNSGIVEISESIVFDNLLRTS